MEREKKDEEKPSYSDSDSDTDTPEVLQGDVVGNIKCIYNVYMILSKEIFIYYRKIFVDFENKKILLFL